MLFRSVTTFLPRSKCLLISWPQSPSAVILEPRKIKYDTVYTVSPRSEERRVGKEWKQCQTLFLWAPKSRQMVTAAMKLKGPYAFEENMTNLGNILKSRDITLPKKVCLFKAIVFPVVMYGCESWTIKKTEHRRIDAFELWCWRRLLRVPWTARRSNQSILKEITPGCSLVGLMLKLKLQYFGHQI